MSDIQVRGTAAGLHRHPVLQDLVVTACGFLASSATAWALFEIERLWDVSLYSLMVWFVIPAGALIAGMGAAAGYYVGARIADARPTRLLLVNMIVVSASTFFAIHWQRYDAIVGTRGMASSLSFWHYLDLSLTHQTMTVRSHGVALTDTGELGVLGYGLAALQVVGFAMGGFVVYGMLAKLPFCDRCARYLAVRDTQKRFADSAESFEAMVHALTTRWRQDDLKGAAKLQRGWGLAKMSKACRVMSTLERRQCPGCRVNWLHYRAQRFDGRHWEADRRFGFRPLPGRQGVDLTSLVSPRRPPHALFAPAHR